MSEIDEESFIIFHPNPRIHFFCKNPALRCTKVKADNKVTHGLFDVPQMRVEHGDQAVVDQGAEKNKSIKI